MKLQQRLGYSRYFSETSSARRPHAPSLKMELQLSAPNGKKWTQPLGLFINNEFVKSSTGEVITSVNPTFVLIASSAPSDV